MQVLSQFQGGFTVVVAVPGQRAARDKSVVYTQDDMTELCLQMRAKDAVAGVYGMLSVADTESPAAQMAIGEHPGFSHRLSKFRLQSYITASGDDVMALVAEIHAIGKMGQVLYNLLQTKSDAIVFDLEAFTKDTPEGQKIETALTWNIVPADPHADTVNTLTAEQAAVLATHQHYKGGLYRLIGPAQDSESNQEMVVYEHLYPHPRQLWVRPRDMFFGLLEDGRVRFAVLETQR